MSDRADVHGSGDERPGTGTDGDGGTASANTPVSLALEIPDGGHFVQEWGKEIAEAAVTAFA